MPYPNGNTAQSGRIAHDPVSVSKNFRNLDAQHGWVPGRAMDPLTTSLKAAKAERVGPGGFRSLGENAGILRPLVGRGFQVWELPEGSAWDGKEYHEWRVGVRLGPNASGT